MFRPYGYTPGHALEWARLALQLWALGGRKLEWLPDAARRLFAQAVAQGWDGRAAGSITRSNTTAPRGCATGCGGRCARGSAPRISSPRSTATPSTKTGTAASGTSSRGAMIDRREGGWRPQLDDSLNPIAGYFVGKPDLYHALQACLIPLYPADGSLTRGILTGS